jgi:MFS family permease
MPTSPAPRVPSSRVAPAPIRRNAPWSEQLWFLVLAGGVVMGLSLGVRHVQGLFLVPITLDRGWTREALGFALAVQNLTWGIAQPFTGMLADRFGSSKVIGIGLLLYAAGLFSMAHSATSAAFVLTAGICVGIALACTAFGIVNGALSRLAAPDRRSWALGVAGAIGGVGQFAMVPGAQWLMNGWGWVTALVVLSAILALMLPLALPLRDQSPAKPGGTSRSAELPMSAAVREAMSHRGFWLLNLGFLACGFQLAFIATHLPAYLLDAGMRASDTVAALAIIALANVAGIYWCGLLGGKHRRKYLLSGLYLARAGAMALFVLLPLSTWSVYVFAAIMGVLWLGAVPLTTGVLSQIFGVRYISTLFGFVFLGHQLGSFLGVWLGGYVFDATQSYGLIWLCAIGLGLVAALLHWPIDDREIVRRPASGLA